MSLLGWLMGGLGVLLGGTLLAVILWRRFYQDDANNAVRRIAKNSVVPLATRLVVRALDMVFLLVLYRTLPAIEIGPYTLAALLVANYLGTFTEFGLGVLLTREVAQRPGDARQLFGVTLLLRWALVLVAVPIALLLVWVYELLAIFEVGEAISPVGQQAIWILLLTLLPAAYSGAVTALYHAAERMEVPAVVELITAVLSIAARIGVLLAGFGILGLAWSAVVVSTITAFIYLGLQLSAQPDQGVIAVRPTLSWDWLLAWQLLPLAFPLMLNNLLNAVFFRFDTFLIKAMGGGMGDVLLQQYALPYQILNIALILPPVVTFAVFPLLARRATGERTDLALAQNRTLQLLLILAFPLAMGLCVAAEDLVVLFTRRQSADYLPISAEVLTIIAWFLPFSFVNGLLQYVLIAIDRQRAITRAFIIGAVFNMTANVLLIPWYGLYAASVVTILSELVLLAVFLPLLRHEGLTPPLLSLAWRPALAALAMGGVMLLLLGTIGWVIAGLTGVVMYGGVLWLVGGIGKAEFQLLQRVIR